MLPEQITQLQTAESLLGNVVRVKGINDLLVSSEPYIPELGMLPEVKDGEVGVITKIYYKEFNGTIVPLAVVNRLYNRNLTVDDLSKPMFTLPFTNLDTVDDNTLINETAAWCIAMPPQGILYLGNILKSTEAINSLIVNKEVYANVITGTGQVVKINDQSLTQTVTINSAELQVNAPVLRHIVSEFMQVQTLPIPTPQPPAPAPTPAPTQVPAQPQPTQIPNQAPVAQPAQTPPQPAIEHGTLQAGQTQNIAQQGVTPQGVVTAEKMDYDDYMAQVNKDIAQPAQPQPLQQQSAPAQVAPQPAQTTLTQPQVQQSAPATPAPMQMAEQAPPQSAPVQPPQSTRTLPEELNINTDEIAKKVFKEVFGEIDKNKITQEGKNTIEALIKAVVDERLLEVFSKYN